MRHTENWRPSKFVRENGALVSARDPGEVGISSRLITDIIAARYWSHMRDHCRGRLLDLGCGKVPLFGVYRDLVAENVCVDWPNSAHMNEHLDFECDLSQGLPLPDASFDTIILSDVLEHIPEPRAIWEEMGRVLTPGGKVLLNVPFYYWLHEVPHDYYRYTEFALRRFAGLAGFEVLVLNAIGGVPEILADIVAKNLTRLRFVGKYGSLATQLLCRQLIRTRLGMRLSESTSAHFPLGYFMIARKTGVGAAVNDG